MLAATLAPALFALVAAAAFLWLRPAALPRPSGFEPDVFTPAELALVQAGDLVFRRGPGLPSDLIVSYLHDGTGLSHGAMVVPGDDTPGWKVVQSINGSFTGMDGVQTQGLARFCRDNLPGSLVLVRPLWPAGARDAALSKAAELLAAAVPYDNRYDFADRSALFCTELLWVLVAETGWTAGGPEPAMEDGLLSFRSFLDRRWFQVVASHNPAVF
jgi:hypothetical protein